MVKSYLLEYAGALKQWVSLSDYLALQAALREALDTWELFTSEHDKGGRQRIAAIRAQFLDDK